MILIVDFGSQLAHLIGRRIKDLGVEVEIVEPELVEEKLARNEYKGMILSGGPASVYEEGAPSLSSKVLEWGKPILGICYGWQLMAKLLGGEVKSTRKEYGPERLKVERKGEILDGVDEEFEVIMSHGDTVMKLPEGFEVLGRTEKVKFAAVADLERKMFGLQFHPEAEHTEFGRKILSNFVLDVCGEKGKERVVEIEAMVERVRQQVGEEEVIMAVSGGVDSTVAAVVIGKAIGKKLIPVYVKSGLMRPKTEEWVRYVFEELLATGLVVVEAEERFRETLRGVIDPEEKRKRVGELYVEIFKEEAQKRQGVKFLGQGTIYSDVVESKGGGKHSAKIKSHHNVGGLPKELGFELVEPLRYLYKDEVRELGRRLGLPEAVVKQQPFPGPGFAIRIRGEVTAERLEQEKLADAIVLEEIEKAGLLDKVFQCFAVMTGAQSTAVKGDAREFGEVVAVRAYESSDVMTSRWARLPVEVLDRISRRIVNEVPGVSRVVYDISTKPPATMEWE